MKVLKLFNIWILWEMGSYSRQIYEDLPDQTAQAYDEACPADMYEFDDKCYVFNATGCPFYAPLPFEGFADILNNISDWTRLDIVGNTSYNYFRWMELRGNYGKLFTEELANDSVHPGDYYKSTASFGVAVQPNFSYAVTDEKYDYLCAYDSWRADQTYNNLYCDNYDRICAKRDKARNTRNCHCHNVTSHHFCQTTCDGKKYDETFCRECFQIRKDYGKPGIFLGLIYGEPTIYIEVEAYLTFLPINEYNLMVYCFTDADQLLHDVTYRYNSSASMIYDATGYKYVWYQIEPLPDYLGHYWCEGLYVNDSVEVISSGPIIGGQMNQPLRESFTVNITVPYIPQQPLTIHETYLEALAAAIEPQYEAKFLHLYDTVSGNVTIGYRLYFNKSVGKLLDIINATVENLIRELNLSTVTASPSFCPKDITHFPNGVSLTWPDTPLGMRVLPLELCLLEDSTPVTRQCLGEYLYGTYWSEVDATRTCVNDSGRLFGSATTVDLHALAYEEADCSAALQNLDKLLTDHHIFADVHFMALIIRNGTDAGGCDLEKVVNLTSKIMDIDPALLNSAQQLLNSTDMLLYALDKILNIDVPADEVLQIRSKNVYVQVSDARASNVTGAALYAVGDSWHLKTLRNDTTVDNIEKKGLKVAAFLTEKQLKQIRKLDRKDPMRLVVVLFKSHVLFNQAEHRKSTGFPLGLYVTGFEEPALVDDVRVLIRSNRRYRAHMACSFWKYGRDPCWYSVWGLWEGDASAASTADLHFCRYDHMTNYAILVGSEGGVVLSIIAAVGCVLSLLGGVSIILTGIVHKSWRENSGTKILLNFVILIVAQNVILSVASGIDGFTHEGACVATGALLHYSVGSEFSWMVVIAYLQYLRYVKVLYAVNSKFVISTALTAWSLPIIPVVVILAVDPNFYIQEEFCYLRDQPLYWGVFLPVSVTMLINTAIFTSILYNVCSKKNAPSGYNTYINALNLRLVLLLYFLLGLYWLFGIAARLTNSIALDYMFCLSASLQGFALFAYYIVFNKMTKTFWANQLKRSQILNVMATWLEQKKNAGPIKLDRSRHNLIKNDIESSLKEC